MASKRIIDCIGASDEDMAHLRLLLRTARIHLRDEWRWGAEDQADIVVVDPRSLIGDSALRRTLQRGVACARLLAENEPGSEGRHLRKPFKREDLVSLLNGIGASTVVPLSIVTQGDDFFDLDLGEPDLADVATIDWSPPTDIVLRRSEAEQEHEEFATVFRRDPTADKPQFLMPETLGADVGVEYIGETTARSASRADAAGNRFTREGLDDSFIDPSFRRDMELREDENATYPLREYLETALIGGPARIALPGAIPLVVDPKERMFHAQGRLPALEPYCRQPLRLGDWQRLVSSELAALRMQYPARPYLRLIWMERYLNSDGYLSSHLDPGGTYRLTRWLELAQDYPRAFRVGANMMTPLRLHEIARASDVGLAEVFDVVNAYEAIGYVEWARRERMPRVGES
jgi:hypothetical protein